MAVGDCANAKVVEGRRKTRYGRISAYNGCPMKSDADELTDRHQDLVHSDARKVVSHVQRESGEWVINTLMIDGCSVPFRYKRRRKYRSLQGGLVNLTYYPDLESVAGIEVEIMKVVRIKRA